MTRIEADAIVIEDMADFLANGPYDDHGPELLDGEDDQGEYQVFGLTIEQSQAVAEATWSARREHERDGQIRAFQYMVNHIESDPLKEIITRANRSGNVLAYTLATVAQNELRRRREPESEIPILKGANVVTLDTVQPERVEWLMRGYIPLGKLTIIDGDPGLGKSLMTLDIAARITTGRPMPDGSESGLAGPSAVVLLTVEDGLGDTIRPRLDVANADASLVVAITGIPGTDGHERPVTLPDDVPLIEQVVRQHGARLVVFDPLMAFLGGETNSYRDQDVRRALSPLARMAEDTGAAVVIVRHLNKASGTNAVYRGGGSIGIIGAARSGLLVAKDPEDESEQRRILAVTKSNLAALAPSLAYRVLTDEHERAYLVWEGQTNHTTTDLLSIVTDDERSARDDAKQFLRHCLKDGPLPAADVLRNARSYGVAEKTLRRAANDMEILKRKEGFGSDGQWVWELPKTANATLSWTPQNVDTLADTGHLSVSDQVLCRVCSSPLPTPDDRVRGAHARCLNGVTA